MNQGMFPAKVYITGRTLQPLKKLFAKQIQSMIIYNNKKEVIFISYNF